MSEHSKSSLTDAVNLLERYGRPEDDILNVLWVLAGYNEDRAHGREMTEANRKLGWAVRGLLGAEDPLVAFFYILVRDHLPLGVVQDIVDNHAMEAASRTPHFSQPELEKYARGLVERLSRIKGLK